MRDAIAGCRFPCTETILLIFSISEMISLHSSFDLPQKYAFQHVSTGDTLRREAADPGSAYGAVIRCLGKHVPPQITFEILKKVIRRARYVVRALFGKCVLACP